MNRIRIYETSDVHGYFYPTSYGDREEKEMGLFRCVAGFERDEDTLYIDGGDILQGSAFSYYCKQILNDPTPIAEVMNACKCDYYTLGNHDFNYGMEYLKKYIKSRHGVCVCQNVTDTQGRSLFPYVIHTMSDGTKVGIVGIVTEYVNVWEKKENLEGICITDPYQAAKDALDEMRGQADLTVCVYHGGFECDLKSGECLSDTKENVGYKIATELEFDILLTGHQHMSVDGQAVHGTYVVQPLEYAKEYHCLEAIREDGQEKWKITSEKRKALHVADQELCRRFAQIEDKVQIWLDETCGQLDRELLPGEKADMALHGSPIADFFNQVQRYFSKAQISAVGLANEIAGFRKNVTNREVIATYPYPNTLVVLEITGEDLKHVMERSAEYLSCNAQGEVIVDESFLIPKVEHYNYDYYSGVRYRIDPAREKGQRICDLSYNGNEIKDTDVFSICINNYRSTGAGGYPWYPECKVLEEINIEMVDLIMEYFQRHPKVVIEA